MTLDELYAAARDTPSDINEHVPKLAELASSCEHVTEFGVRSGVSTTALLYGQPRTLVCYDVVPEWINGAYEQLYPLRGETDLQFVVGDTREVTIVPTDLLFVDTLHTYAQLKAELERHANKARKFLAFHDTTTFGYVGEDGKRPGLLQALGEFLHRSPQWKILSETERCNGLVVLRRVA